jgi:hypothetical protein
MTGFLLGAHQPSAMSNCYVCADLLTNAGYRHDWPAAYLESHF